MNDNIEVLRGLEKEWQEYVDKHDGGYSHVEGVKKCLSELRAALAALSAQAEAKSQRERAEAWDAVVAVLDEVAADWLLAHGTGIECAVSAIRKLAQQPEAQAGGAVAEPPSNEVWPPDGAVWLAPVATDAPADPKLMQYAWGRSSLSSGQMAEAYQCIVSAAQECGQVYRLPLAAPATPPAKVPAVLREILHLATKESRWDEKGRLMLIEGIARGALAAAPAPKEGCDG